MTIQDNYLVKHSCCAHTTQSPPQKASCRAWYLSSSQPQLNTPEQKETHTSTNHLALDPPLPEDRKQKRNGVDNGHRQAQLYHPALVTTRWLKRGED
jgi:hypothetical protein